MPCDIGYKNISRIKVPPKLPQEFSEKVRAPKIDKQLLETMGVDDVVFLDWVSGLETDLLFDEALKRARKAVGRTEPVTFSVSKGELEMKASYRDANEKKKVEVIARKVSERFQMEIIGIIAELLDYRFVLSKKTVDGTTSLVLEGEKEEPSAVHKYLKVSLGAAGEGVLVFEHFESRAALKQEQAKFLMLAQKFGITITVSEERESGQGIPEHVEHQHFLKQEQ